MGESYWRPEVEEFADAMETRLRLNDHKGGWKSMKPQQILARVCDEMAELLQSFRVEKTQEPDEVGPREAFIIAAHHMQSAAAALRHYTGTIRTRGAARALSDEEARYTRNLSGIRHEAVDVANFIMMLTDVCGALEAEKKKESP